jgi:hypothetical protein
MIYENVGFGKLRTVFEAANAGIEDAPEGERIALRQFAVGFGPVEMSGRFALTLALFRRERGLTLAIIQRPVGCFASRLA